MSLVITLDVEHPKEALLSKALLLQWIKERLPPLLLASGTVSIEDEDEHNEEEEEDIGDDNIGGFDDVDPEHMVLDDDEDDI